LANTEFDITAERLDIIVDSCNALGISVTKENVSSLYTHFEKLTKNVKEQYLAHIARAMEVFYANAFESGRNHTDWNSVLQDFLSFIKEKNI
jgi:hypothetical protein